MAVGRPTGVSAPNTEGSYGKRADHGGGWLAARDDGTVIPLPYEIAFQKQLTVSDPDIYFNRARFACISPRAENYAPAPGAV
jgi:hypothetical protein